MAIKLSEIEKTTNTTALKPKESKSISVKPWQNIPKEPDLLEEILKNELSGKYRVVKRKPKTDEKPK